MSAYSDSPEYSANVRRTTRYTTAPAATERNASTANAWRTEPPQHDRQRDNQHAKLETEHGDEREQTKQPVIAPEVAGASATAIVRRMHTITKA